jgi:DNA-binding Xre family transcriptional regulator
MMILNVKDIAEARGIKNAKQLADACGLHLKSAYQLWKGEARMIALDTLESLCKTLRVQAGVLFEIIPDIEPASTVRQQDVPAKPARKRTAKA